MVSVRQPQPPDAGRSSRRTTFALDLADVAGTLTPRTTAVIAVPMWGYPADGPELARACYDWGVPLVEDVARTATRTRSGRLR
jgi:8-amino-3,8-dideoxy-alpha-D-manno-octulosonate transaminase